MKRFWSRLRSASVSAALAWCLQGAESPREESLTAFLQAPRIEVQPLFGDERFPNMVVTLDGTALATWGSQTIRARRSEDGGETWGEDITIVDPGFHGGGTTVDETTGDILVFVEERHPPSRWTVYRSRDDGKTWRAEAPVVRPDRNGNQPSMHMNEHGITLRHGEHSGRLLRPSRWYAGKNERARWPEHYTSAIYSDDGGHTWVSSEPFPAFGTGEAAVAELSDGSIYYNSRRHWAPVGLDPRRRWVARSRDDGATWEDLSICAALPDGPQDTDYGCMGGLVRLPVRGRDILIYSNCDSPSGRHHGTVWASFDGGRTWPVKRLVFEKSFAYSSLAAGRPETQSEGWIFLHFEGGPKGGSAVARFNLSWILGGQRTADGELPDWLPSARATAGTPSGISRASLAQAKTELGRAVEFKGKRVLKEKTLKLMFTDQLNGVGGGFQFGLGFAIGEVTLGSDNKSRKAMQYSWAGYASTDFRLVPEEQLFLIFMRQRVPSSHDLANRLFSIVYEGVK